MSQIITAMWTHFLSPPFSSLSLPLRSSPLLSLTLSPTPSPPSPPYYYYCCDTYYNYQYNFYDNDFILSNYPCRKGSHAKLSNNNIIVYEKNQLSTINKLRTLNTTNISQQQRLLLLSIISSCRNSICI